MKTLFAKTPVTPTHEERIAEAESLKIGALDVFDQAVRDLELAEALHLSTLADIDAEITELYRAADAKAAELNNLAFQAEDNAGKAGDRAAKIRALIG